jgi:hypothetical protein
MATSKKRLPIRRKTAAAVSGNCPDPVGQPSGAVPVTEDDGWYYMPPPAGAGNGPFIPVVERTLNNGLPYWESAAAVIAAAMAQMQPVPGPVGAKKRGRKRK